MLTYESIARDVLRLFVWFPVRWTLNAVPTRLAFSILRLMGDVHYFLSGSKRALLLRNLKTVFRDKGLTGTDFFPYTIRQYFRNHYVNRLQILILHRLNGRNVEKIHRFEGTENIDEALQLGKGCILVYPHFGPLFLPPHALGLMGYPSAALLLTTDEGLSFIGRRVAYRQRVKYEGMMKTKIIPVQSFLRPLFDHLRGNGVLFTMGDGTDDGKLIGKYSEHAFFDKKLLFPMGPALLALKTGSPLLPIFPILQPDDSYKTIILKSIKTDDADEMVSRFAEVMQSYIERFPYLWHFWDGFEAKVIGGVHGS
jgi:KDO2-lipid IV(A) lauroyltransferase